MSTETLQQNSSPASTNQQGGGQALPTIDQIANEHFGKQPGPEQVPVEGGGQTSTPEQQKPQLDDFQKLSQEQRKVYAEKERLRKEREELEREKQRREQEREERYSNIDNIVDSFMNPDGQVNADSENLPGSKDFDPVAYEKELTEKILNKINGQTEKTKEQEQIEAQTNKFKEGITGFLSEKASEFPLTQAMGQTDLVFEIIEQQYAKDAKAYGYDYADDNIMTNEQAAQLAEKHLASQIDGVLQSQHMREFLLTRINNFGKEENPTNSVQNQSNPVNQSTEPRTLTNNMTQTTSQNQHIDEKNMTEEERFERALAAINKG